MSIVSLGVHVKTNPEVIEQEASASTRFR